jgi:hypothetical protein
MDRNSRASDGARFGGLPGPARASECADEGDVVLELGTMCIDWVDAAEAVAHVAEAQGRKGRVSLRTRTAADPRSCAMAGTAMLRVAFSAEHVRRLIHSLRLRPLPASRSLRRRLHGSWPVGKRTEYLNALERVSYVVVVSEVAWKKCLIHFQATTPACQFEVRSEIVPILRKMLVDVSRCTPATLVGAWGGRGQSVRALRNRSRLSEYARGRMDSTHMNANVLECDLCAANRAFYTSGARRGRRCRGRRLPRSIESPRWRCCLFTYDTFSEAKGAGFIHSTAYAFHMASL